ncbi:MAG: ABC transporter permease [Clostridia bacterium]|nr:ABC transporter permease [Clostridia bacterium]
MNIWLNFLIDSMAFGATFIYGSTGEILTEKAGHLNLGIPGIMCMGGAGGCLVLNAIGRSSLPPFLIVILGILGSLALAMLCGMIYSFLTVTLRANQNVTGLALTTFGVGLMKVIMSKLDATVYLVGPKQMYRWPFANRQDSLQAMGILFFAAVIIAVLAGWILFRTKTGLHLRAVGENPATADAVGINVTKYKYAATCIGSGIAGLGGFYYIIDYMASQEAYLSLEAFGWLSIALVIFALWRPPLTIIGSVVFGFLFSVSSFITNVPWINVTMAMKPILKMLPYVVTILVLIVSSIRNKRENQPPASLGLSYFREER